MHLHFTNLPLTSTNALSSTQPTHMLQILPPQHLFLRIGCMRGELLELRCYGMVFNESKKAPASCSRAGSPSCKPAGPHQSRRGRAHLVLHLELLGQRPALHGLVGVGVRVLVQLVHKEAVEEVAAWPLARLPPLCIPVLHQAPGPWIFTPFCRTGDPQRQKSADCQKIPCSIR